MKRKNTTRNALFTSIISLLLCVSMLVGTTFAWFTDSVTSGRNVIAAGNLDVELYHTDKDETNVDVDSSTKLFNDVTLWEPGAVLYDTLQVKNVGTLALKYNLDLTVLNETVVNGYKLSDVIKVGVINSALGANTTRDGIVGAISTWTPLAQFSMNQNGVELEVGGEDTFTVVLYWQPNTNEVDNRYNMNNENQGKKLELDIGVNLYATQVEAEFDSFGDDYDAGAYLLPTVYNAEELTSALANGESVKLGNDITVTDPVVISEDAEDVVLNLAGYTLNGSIEISKGAEVTVMDGTITNTDSSVSGIQNNGGALTLNDVNITSARHGVRVEGGTVTINGGNYKASGTSGMTQHALNVSDSAVVTVNGGTFVGPKGSGADSGAAVNVQANSKVTINGGSFSNGLNNTLAGSGDLTVYGGTFDQDPSDYVADDYSAVNNGNNTYTVLPKVEDATLTYVSDGLYTDGTNYYIASAAGLKAANDILASTDGRYSKGFNRSYILLSDIDASGITWTTAWMEGNSATDVALTLNGQGHTISNLTTTGALLSGNSKGAVIKDITFDNVTVESTGYHVAVIWGEAYGSMTLENVSVENSSITGLCNVAALVGSTAQDVTVTYTDCSVENTAITATGVDGECDPTGANVFMGRALGGTKLVFGGNNASVGNTVNNDGGLVGGGIYGYTAWVGGETAWAGTGKCDTFTNWNGIAVAATAEQLATAVANGATNIYLLDGEYEINGCNGKTLTISGSKNAILMPTPGECPSDGEGVDTGFDGSTVTFNGVTIKSNGKNYSGWSRLTGVYNNCYFDGAYTTINYTHEFNNCTFKPNGYIWTWGATQIDFNNCEFVGDSRAILAHGGANTVINIKDCQFNATEVGKTGAGDPTAAVEIDPTGSNTYTIRIAGSSITDSYAGWYRVKDGSTGHIVTVDGDDIVNTIKIGTLAELQAFANDVNVNGNSYSGKTVVLTADINLNNEEWTPIGQTGSNGAATYFQGTFDGKGYTISNLKISQNNTYTGGNYASGLFGFIDAADANIRNLTIQNANVTGTHWTAVIVGYLTGKIENCKVYNATVVCNHINDSACGDKAGVIAGMVQKADSYVKNCYVEQSSVSAGRDAGVIIGCCNDKTAIANSTGNTFSNVTVTANNTCTDSGAGENINAAVIGRDAS